MVRKAHGSRAWSLHRTAATVHHARSATRLYLPCSGQSRPPRTLRDLFVAPQQSICAYSPSQTRSVVVCLPLHNDLITWVTWLPTTSAEPYRPAVRALCSSSVDGYIKITLVAANHAELQAGRAQEMPTISQFSPKWRVAKAWTAEVGGRSGSVVFHLLLLAGACRAHHATTYVAAESCWLELHRMTADGCCYVLYSVL